MVATRSGLRVDSSSETTQKNSSSVQATPSAGRRTRSTAQQAEGRVQQTCEEPSSQLSLTPVTSTKRCTRKSRLHSPPLPSTPVDSVHDADVSDVESACSAVSTTAPPVTRSRVKTRLLRAGSLEHEEISEVESCSSVASTSKSGLRSSRSTRRKLAPQSSDSAPAERDVKPDLGSEAESCSSVMSKSQRVPRGQKKAPLTRSCVKLQTVGSEVSDSDSCTSSSLGRASRRRPRPIPISLEDMSESSQSPQTGRQTRATGRKAAAPVDVTETPSYDSEGFESGPTYSLSRNNKKQPTGRKAEDSEIEAMDISSSFGSPCSTQSGETPSSSRANSRTSSRGRLASRRSARKPVSVPEVTAESADCRLESTLTAGDEDRTLLEEGHLQTSEGVNDPCSSDADTQIENRDVPNTSAEESHISAPACAEKADEESAVITKDQEEELSPEDKDEDASDVEMMQETVPPSERAQPSPSVAVTTPEEASETTEEVVEKQEAADVTEEEEEVSRLKTDTQKVVEDPVQSTKTVSLLDSSDDDDDDSGEEQECEEEEEKRGGPSNMSAESVKGLFMIDTRPGQDADELYYREDEEVTNKTHQEEEEEDEEFVDEEEEEDDEDTQILFSSRSAHLKEMSSRIDPGIRVKELGGLYISFDGSKSKPVSSSLPKLKEKKNLDEVMKKSVIGPDFEKKDAVPPYSESKQALKLKHRAEREMSTGDGWFNMKAPELTQELKGDLKVLKMRGSLDPKRFYKKNDRDGFPKYFQIGTVVDNSADFYHSQIPKKERKRTMVEELLADADFRHKNKKRYQQIMAEKAALGADRRRRKKKFHKK
ncbi:deoxynucleotidyltransferase terminal-interacting protein 2 [Austrofundulus limnaeus]|uniref:Deoxynucleotidyltransferase terminal-interacting protein 2 n=1 Tax=Austrofundulus limnaeus TaxID=52670 RepID=A0A2I4BPJ4_AUSLI|nr:PREDICTED: deoxynucleotidyltransferase terminal-interacting protein 2 [Austrofundulus limnaeus]